MLKVQGLDQGVELKLPITDVVAVLKGLEWERLLAIFWQDYHWDEATVMKMLETGVYPAFRAGTGSSGLPGRPGCSRDQPRRA